MKPARSSGGHTALIFFLLLIAFTSFPSVRGAERLRLIVETDAGGDPDDEQSLVRLLLYSNEFQFDAIIANREFARDGENKNPERTGLAIVQRLIKAFGKHYENLANNDPRYPGADSLLAATVPGYNNTDKGVRAIINAVDHADAHPIWYMDWGTDHGGATNNLQRALDQVLAERGPAGYAKFKTNINVIFEDRMLTNHTAMSPPWRLWINTWAPPMNNLRWYHRFSALTATAGGFDFKEHLLNHPFGSLYPTNTTHPQKEGDSMAFIYLMQMGMSEPTQPTWGGWAGRYGLRENYPGLPYYWANQTDAWNGSTNRDNTIARWAVHLQNDLRARLDYCVKPPAQCNHPPRLKLNGKDRPFYLNCKPNEIVTFTTTGSDAAEPDQQLKFEWLYYPEPGTYRGNVAFDATDRPTVQLRIPADAAGQTIHIILAATDNGSPPLTRYGRAILHVAP